MSTLEKIFEAFPDETFLIADGFDDAIVGVEEKEFRLVYSIEKCINILVNDDEMSYEDAIEHFNFNVSGAYVGDKTPIWIHTEFEL